MISYYYFSLRFFRGEIFTDCCTKNTGYGAFLALIYKISSFDNYQAVRIVQILMDLLVAILVFMTAKNIFDKKTAFFSYIIYIFNPLTASYTGLRLPETISIFYITCIAFLLSLKSFKSNIILWFIFGIVMGLTLFTRMQFLYFSLVFIPVAAVLFFKKYTKLLFLLISVSGFLIANSYSLYANYHVYKKISLMPITVGKYWNLYLNFYNDIRYPEIIVDYIKVNPTYKVILMEYFFAVDYHNLTKITKVEEKYKALFFKKIQTGWPVFLKNSLQNLVWLWDKNHLYMYSDPFYPADSVPMRILNIILLTLFFTGIISYIKQRKIQVFHDPVAVFSVLFMFYLSALVPLVSNESRHTMIYYSIIMLWAGYGLTVIINKLKKQYKRN